MEQHANMIFLPGWLVGGIVRLAAVTLTNILSAILTLFILVWVSTAHAVIPASQRTVLTNLYASTNGAAWTNKTNWNGAVGTECTWFGVTCDASQNNVVGIVLDSNNLLGTVPALSGLLALQNFDVLGNKLTGPFPSLSELTALRNLDARLNVLTGPIPSLSGLTALQRFDVGSNQLTGSIPSLSGLAALQHFDASLNELTGPIPPLSGLTSLQTLDVGYNQLTGSIPPLSGLTALQHFDVSSNLLAGPIPSLSGLMALQDFDVPYNVLIGSIPSLSGLTALQRFDVGGNQLTGPIPSLSGLTALQDFDVGGNQLTGSIPPLSGLTALQGFGVSENQLTGSIPLLSGLTALRDLGADGNRLTGSIPSLSGLTGLQYFDVGGNQLTGSIPSLSGLTTLRNFSVYRNQLSGRFPSLAGLAALETINVSYNRLTGPVSAPSPQLTAGDSDLCNNFLATSTDAAIDAAWVAAQNPFFVDDGKWPICQSPPVFPLFITDNTSPTVANVTADIQYRPQDVGSTGSVYVFAVAPANVVKNVSAQAFVNYKGQVTRGTNTADTPLPCVLAQLTASGQLTAVTAGTLQAYLTGVLSSQGASVSVLNGVSTALLSGSVFYVGYGSNSTAMINSGTQRLVATVPGPQTCQPLAPQTGWWWNPAEDGRGFGIEVHGNNLFMSGYLYDDAGHATWVIAPGPVALDGAFFNGTIYQVANGQTLTGVYKPNSAPTVVGTITLSFTDARHGTLIWPGGVIAIQRFDDVIGSGRGVTPDFVPENGWWWNEAETGRGYFMEFKNNFAFIAGYMYEADGRAVWYTAQNTMTTPKTFTSSWLQVANGQTLTGPYKKPVLINSNVGPVSITFQSAVNAVLTLPGGRQVAITRQRF